MFNNKKELVEIFGIVGVIASLIFVGMQLLLDRRLAIADQYQARMEMRVQGNLSQLQSPEYINLTASRWKAERPFWWNSDIEALFIESEEPMSAVVLDTNQFSNFGIIMDNNAYQYKLGLMEEENWLPLRNTLKNFILQDPMRKAYISTRGSLPNLTPVVNEILLEIEAGIDQ